MPTKSRSDAARVLFLLIPFLLLVIAIWGPRFWRQIPDWKEANPQASGTSSDVHPLDSQRESTAYVGSDACVVCHQEISESYRLHPMWSSTRSLEDLSSDGLAADLCQVATVRGTDRVLMSECRGGNLVHTESMFDRKGQRIYELPYSMAFVVGSGQRAKAFLHRRENLLFMSPLNWYAQTQDWELAPSYRADDPRRFERRVSRDCLACHAGRIVESTDSPNVFPDPVFSEMSIGCERCHGPGADHVQYHKTSHAGNRKDDPIVNPGKLDSARREAVCYQCHLSASARVLRPGRTHSDFRPGMHLVDVWAILDRGTDVPTEERTRSVNHVQQMRSSRCFVESANQLGCLSCHDPHSVPQKENRVDFYRERCLTCHGNDECLTSKAIRDGVSNSCIDCHMPRLDSSNMSHVVQTDHRILREPRKLPPVWQPANDARLEFFGTMKVDLPRVEQQRALALGTFTDCSKKQKPFPPGLRQELHKSLSHFPDDAALFTSLGIINYVEGSLPAARHFFERAIQQSGDMEIALDGLLKTQYQLADWQSVIELADKLLVSDPGDSAIHAMRGDALLQLGRNEDAILAVERAVSLHPSHIPYREWLLERYLRSGRKEDAERQSRLIDRIQDATVPSEADLMQSE
ncbi:MAG: hypothetical protein KDA80_16340 [Planctomycetaceae bacterium]|nr:hypothetical protein [Planctomycetaceae bacterium]